MEEIEEHIKAKKPVMLYFSSAPVLPDSIDPGQYSELKKFKESCESNGLYETYFEINDFKSKFYRQLQVKINSEPSFKKVSQSLLEAEPAINTTIPDIPKLSREAQILLKEASLARNGDIFQLHFIGGFQVQSNGKVFGDSGNPRDQATWKEPSKNWRNTIS